VVKIQIEVFWAVTLCNEVVGYQCFGGPCCFHLLDETNAIGCHDPEDLNLYFLVLDLQSHVHTTWSGFINGCNEE
jgi:hypothetical protein